MSDITLDPESRVGHLWQDMQSSADLWETSPQGLEAQVRQTPFVQDPFGLRVPVTHTDSVQTQQVLEFCYGHEACYPLLAKHSFPLPFYLSDFDTENLSDDQVRHQINLEVSNVLNENKRSSPIEKARAIFDWSLSGMHFYGDCPREETAWKALLQDCGYCTESSAALFATYLDVGLEADFYFETDWVPSMLWYDRYMQNGLNFEDHVLLGFSDGEGDVVFVDRINQEWGKQHPYAKQISRSNFAAVVELNKLSDLVNQGKSDEAIRVLQAYHEMEPSDIFRYALGVAFLSTRGVRAIAHYAKETLQQFSDHPGYLPLEKLLTSLINNKLETFAEELLAPESDVGAQLIALQNSSPGLSSDIYTLMAMAMANQIFSDLEKIPEGDPTTPDVRSYLSKTNLLFLASLKCLKMALLINPNNVKAYLVMASFLNIPGNIFNGVGPALRKISEEILVSHPDHTPLHYLAATTVLVTTEKNPPSPQDLSQAMDHVNHVIAREPGHPMGHLLRAFLSFKLNSFDQMDEELEVVKSLSGQNNRELDENYYGLSLSGAMSRDDETRMRHVVRSLLQERPRDGVDLILNFISEGKVFIISGTTPNPDELKHVLHDAPVYKMFYVIVEELSAYPRAQANLEAQQAWFAVWAALAEGEVVWKERIAAIREPQRIEVQEEFYNILDKIDTWVTADFQTEDVVDWLADVLSFMAPDLPQPLHDKILSIEVELVNNYIMLDKKKKASEVWDKMLALDTTEAMLLYFGRVMGLRDFDLNARLIALDILYERRELLAPEAKKKLVANYESITADQTLDVALMRDIQRKIHNLRTG